MHFDPDAPEVEILKAARDEPIEDNEGKMNKFFLQGIIIIYCNLMFLQITSSQESQHLCQRCQRK